MSVCVCKLLTDVSIIYKSRYVWVRMHRDFHTSTTFNVYVKTTLSHTAAFGRDARMNMHSESTDETREAERSNSCDFHSCQTVRKKHKAKLFYLTRQEKNM